MLTALEYPPFKTDRSIEYSKDLYNQLPDTVMPEIRELVWNMLNPECAERCSIHEALASAQRILRDVEGSHAHAAAEAAAEHASGLAKFVAPSLRLGKADDAILGLPRLLGISDSGIFYPPDKIGAMRKEFETCGREEDKMNFSTILSGTYQTPSKGEEDSGASQKCKTLEEVMASAEVKKANLSKYHVLALMLYTTSSYASINEPLRKTPIEQPHPFAVTLFYISEAIKRLRIVQTETIFPKTYWRGLKDRKLSEAFFKANGGTEYGCMSTSALKEIAFDFAKSSCPLVFKLVVSGALTDGADISFLSVYPLEKEVLYPPLTYLRVKKGKPSLDMVGSKTMLVIEVEPQFPS